jgi:PAS domain S-box-containing protein
MENDVGVKGESHAVLPEQPGTVKVLLLEDDEIDGDLILDALRSGGVVTESKRVVLRSEFLLALEDFKPELVLSDHKLPDITGVQALAHVKDRFPHIPFILVTGALGEEAAVEAMRSGATDYILKDKLFRLVPAVNRALREAGEAVRRKETEELLRLQHIKLKTQNEKLFESELRFRQLAENIAEVFWMTDVDKKTIIYVSAAYETVTGRTCQSLYTSPTAWVEALHPDDREAVVKAVFTKQAAGTYDEIYRIIRPDGSTRWIHDRAFPVRNVAGDVYRIAGIAEDITERKLAEQRLETRNAVIRVLAEASTLDEAVAKILRTICECLGWEIGALWKPHPEGIKCMDTWCSPKPEMAEFEKATKETTFNPGDGLPGQVWHRPKSFGCLILQPSPDGFFPGCRLRLSVAFVVHSAFRSF